MRITSTPRVPSSRHFRARHAAGFPRGGIFALVLAFLFFVAASSPLPAQITNVTNSTSTPTPGSGHDYIKMLNETVNPANGSVSIRVDTPVAPGRQLTLPFNFAYDSDGALILRASPAGGSAGFISNTTFLSQSGWSYGVPLLSADYINKQEQLPNGRYIQCEIDKDFVFQDPSGGRHALYLAGTQQVEVPECRDNPFLSGGDDFVQAFKAKCFGGSCPVHIADADGTVYAFDGPFDHFAGFTQSGASLPTSIEDRNGNEILVTTNSGTTTFTDTAGRPAVSFSGFGTSGNTVNISGLPANSYTVEWGSTPAKFGVNPIVVGPPDPQCVPMSGMSGNMAVITAITLPNQQSYKFSYDSTYGLLNQITYPSGGWIKYTWALNTQSEIGLYPDANFLPGCVYTYDWPAIQHRSVSFDGTNIALQQDFSYSIVWASGHGSWFTKQTIVTTHDCARNNFNCIGAPAFTATYLYTSITPPVQPYNLESFGGQIPVESTVVTTDWTGGTLQTVTKTWSDVYKMSCQSTTLPTGQVSRTDYSYGEGHVLTDKKEWDWGQAPVCGSTPTGTPARETVTAIQTFADTPIYTNGPSIFDRPSSVIVNGAGTRVAETDYSYDQNPIASASAVQHDETYYGPTSSAPRGNATTVTKQCFPNCVQNPDTYTAATTTYSYYETGQVYTATAPCGNATCDSMYYGTNKFTTYVYTDSYTSCSGSAPPSGNTNAYLTSETNEKGFTTSYCYGYNDGQLRGSTDENGQPTLYKYNDLLDRLTNISYPIGATIISYNDAPPNPSITVQKEIAASQYLTTVSVMDGVGHVVDSQLTSAPACQIVHTTTTYDGTGKPYQVSNPYCSTSDPTYGLTTYAYDALGRTKTVTHPDSTSIQTAYTGSATQVSDEGNGTKSIVRISQTDGLGRLSSVCEVTNTTVLGGGGAPIACPQNSSFNGFVTNYLYDALDNLIQVSEGSLNPRSFTYNSLSELVCSANPEIQPAACPVSDGGAWVSGTTRYTYDLNGNLLSKTSPAPNQTNPAVSVHTGYGHDVLNRQTDVWPPNGEPDTFYAYDQTGYGDSTGRMTGVGRYDNSDSNWYSYTAPSYDAMGRVTLLNECAVQDCPATHWDVATGYDYLGDITSWTNAFGGTFSATYDDAQQLTGVTNNLSNGNYPSPMLSSAIYNGPGQLISAQVGTGAGVVTETRAYDKRLRPTTLTDGVAYSFDITNYAPDSDILAVTDSVNGTWGYGTGTNYTGGYDDMNRLLMAVPSGKTWSYTYAYDRYGNRWQQNLVGTGGSGPQFSTTFDANNHVSDGTVSYDAAGNVMQDASNTYTYDSQNQMISSLSRSSGSLTCYFYDAFGRRVQKTTGATSCGYPFVGGTSLYYVYDTAGNMIDEVSAPSGGTGTWTRQEIYAAGRHLATFNSSAGQAYWDFSDWLGTERARVNAVTGAVAETCTSLPWGDNLQCTGTDQSPLHFTGKQRDSESGLDDFGARYNSSALGRFMSPDWSSSPSAVPFGDDSDPQSLNLYLYVRDNPLGRTDPTGHCDVDGETRGAFWCAAHLFGLVSTKKEDEAKQAQQRKVAHGVTVGVGAAGNADLGVVKAGAETNVTVAATASISSAAKPSAGVVASGAAVAYSGDRVAAAPNQETKPLVAGAYAGGGITFLASNAANANELKGPFLTVSGNVGGTQGASLALSFDHSGTVVFQLTLGWGLGISGWAVTTNTKAGCVGCD